MSSSEDADAYMPWNPEEARSKKISKRKSATGLSARMHEGKRKLAATGPTSEAAISLPHALAPSSALSAPSAADLQAVIALLKQQNASLLSHNNLLLSQATTLKKQHLELKSLHSSVVEDRDKQATRFLHVHSKCKQRDHEVLELNQFQCNPITFIDASTLSVVVYRFAGVFKHHNLFLKICLLFTDASRETS